MFINMPVNEKTNAKTDDGWFVACEDSKGKESCKFSLVTEESDERNEHPLAP